MKQWQDTSSYRRGAERIPDAFAIDLGKFNLRVHRYHGLQGWFTSCHGLFDCRSLSSSEPEAAKKEALGFFRACLTCALGDVAGVQTT